MWLTYKGGERRGGGKGGVENALVLGNCILPMTEICYVHCIRDHYTALCVLTRTHRAS